MKKLFASLCFLLFLAGCGNDSATSVEGKEEEGTKQADKQPATDDEQVQEKKKVKAEPVTKKDGQGDYHVLFDGDIQVKDNTLTASGTTNLLPGSKLFFQIDALDGVIIGSSATTLVKNDGSFQLEQKLPSNYDFPVVNSRIVFNPASSTDDKITSHYTEMGEPLTGPFVRLYTEGNELRKEISVGTEIPLDNTETVIPIEAPSWNIPEDYGSPNVWMEAEVQEDENFIYISGKSNLLEGTSIHGMLDIEGYITSGYSDRDNTNPDGSFHLVINHPKKKIEDLQGYEIRLKFSPSDSNSFPYIYETYGENGEQLQGNLVVNENGENEIVYVLNVQK
ncbi:hypothetical protein [Niallia endozanthoxylica]|uniref:Uncharacterized protein n=1 Tax=Niallia endozanthoxylica TaxID=2036016 RepID=A0A5J5H8R8_9BACI|nr:hypothetical protein [Niallia endozanthoxylica]KAA9016013.1 hypothetical protein F4V44_22415 [Niallia endozanthoxylica]